MWGGSELALSKSGWLWVALAWTPLAYNKANTPGLRTSLPHILFRRETTESD